jgi:DNA-directed RNA polymerase subunit RPC12/RpoP
MPLPKRYYLCPSCGSGDLQFDACAAWNYVDQRFELITEYDYAHCVTCESEGHPKAIYEDTE